jgi:hypothetical protein
VRGASAWSESGGGRVWGNGENAKFGVPSDGPSPRSSQNLYVSSSPFFPAKVEASWDDAMLLIAEGRRRLQVPGQYFRTRRGPLDDDIATMQLHNDTMRQACKGTNATEQKGR